MRKIILRIPKDGNEFIPEPSPEFLEVVFKDPTKFGDENELGGIAIYSDFHEDAGDEREPGEFPTRAELNFYFDHDGLVAVRYSDDIIDGEVISVGKKHFDSEFAVRDRAGSILTLNRRNLIPKKEALGCAIEFCENGRLDLRGFWENAPY